MLAVPFAAAPEGAESADFTPEAAQKPTVKRRIPSLRNREVFRQVMGCKRSHREVAEKFHLTQPRVTQIVEQVRDWICQVSEAQELGFSPDEALCYAERVLQMEIDAGMKDAMRQWQRSIRTRVKEKEHRNRKGELIWTEKIPTPQYGKIACLGHHHRLSLARARLAGVDVTGRTARKAIEEWKRQQEEMAAEPSESAAGGKPASGPAEVAGDLRSVLAAGSETRAERAPTGDFEESKPLSVFAPAEEPAQLAVPAASAPTPAPTATCAAATASQDDVAMSAADLQNPYRAANLAGLASLLDSHPPAPAPSARNDLVATQQPQPGAIPHFLGKKAKKRLRALRRREARAAALAGVG